MIYLICDTIPYILVAGIRFSKKAHSLFTHAVIRMGLCRNNEGTLFKECLLLIRTLLFLLLKIGDVRWMLKTMGNTNKSNKNIVSAIGTIGAFVTAVTPIVDKIIDNTKGKKREQKRNEEKIIIPSLCDKKFPLEVHQATQLLENLKLKVIPIKLSIKEANAKYKDCFEGQVIDSNIKHNKRVKPGSIIYLKYITLETIKESQKVSDDLEHGKNERWKNRKIEQTEKKAQTKEKFTDVAEKAKSVICFKKKIKKE